MNADDKDMISRVLYAVADMESISPHDRLSHVIEETMSDAELYEDDLDLLSAAQGDVAQKYLKFKKAEET